MLLLQLEKHDQEMIRKKNRMLVLDMIRKRRPVSRTEIARLTGMSAASAGRIVADLLEMGLVKETVRTSAGVGRKATMLDIDISSIMALGVDIDRNLVKIGLVDLDGTVVAEERREFASDDMRPDAAAEAVAAAAPRLAASQGLAVSKLIGVGIGMPGFIDTENGTVVFSAQLGWRNARIAKAIEERLGLPAVLDNDLKVKALGESAARELDAAGTTALVSIGSGVGSALIVDRNIYRGANNIAGEIGHSIIDPNGKLCECGKRGCLQTYLTDLAMLQEANQVKPVASLDELFRLAEAGEAWAHHIIDRACTYAAVTLNNVACVYNPDTIVLTGSFVEDHPGMFETIERKVSAFVGEHFAGTFQVVRSTLGEKSVMIGAAKLILQQRLDEGLTPP